MTDQMRDEFREHEKEFVEFKATANSTLNNMQGDITEIKEMLKDHFKDSGEHENAQAVMLADLNNRMTQQEIIVDKDTIENLKKRHNNPANRAHLQIEAMGVNSHRYRITYRYAFFRFSRFYPEKHCRRWINEIVSDS